MEAGFIQMETYPGKAIQIEHLSQEVQRSRIGFHFRFAFHK